MESVPRGKAGPKRSAMESRFWSKVNRAGDDECWLWMAVTHKGYGMLGLPGKKGGAFPAHRYSYMLAHGSIPPGAEVCHRCDVPGCVNPAHLFVGTHTDNVMDMWAKDRGPTGERNGHSKLTDEIVGELRRSPESIATWSRRLGVSTSVIAEARRGYTWRHVPMGPPVKYRKNQWTPAAVQP